MARRELTAEERMLIPVIDEMEEIAALPGLDIHLAPSAAVTELARILTRFDTSIDDEWRHRLIRFGGALLRLARTLNGDERG